MSMASDARLGEIARHQHGVFSRAQVLAVGFGAGQIERRVRAGVWHRVFPRVYRFAGAPSSPAQSCWAAVLWCGPGCALSHTTAAAIWRLGSVPLGQPDLVVTRNRAPRVDGVAVHRIARLDGADVANVRRLPVTSPVRTIIDLAGVLAPGDLERVIASARSRRLVTVRAVLGRLDELGSVGRPGAALLRTLLAPIGSVWVDRSARMAG
jgi:hypothetical protein